MISGDIRIGGTNANQLTSLKIRLNECGRANAKSRFGAKDKK